MTSPAPAFPGGLAAAVLVVLLAALAAAASAAAQRPAQARPLVIGHRARRRIDVPLIQLIDASGAPADYVARGIRRTDDDLVTRRGLRRIATYADGIGPDKSHIVPTDDADRLQARTTLVRDAHRDGLLVRPFTFRPENQFLPANYRQGVATSPLFDIARGNEPAELRLFCARASTASSPTTPIRRSRSATSGSASARRRRASRSARAPRGCPRCGPRPTCAAP